MNRQKVFGAIPIIVGVLLQSVLIFESSAPTEPFTLGLFAASCLGYVFCLIALLSFRSSLPAVLGACFAIVADALLYYEVFVHPQSSTSALGVLGVPVANVALSIIGILVGWIALAIAKREKS